MGFRLGGEYPPVFTLCVCTLRCVTMPSQASNNNYYVNIVYAMLCTLHYAMLLYCVCFVLLCYVYIVNITSQTKQDKTM